MRILFLVLVISASSILQAADKIEEKKDFSIVCAISKSAEALSKDKYFADKAERMALILGIIEKNIKTDQVKNILRAVAASEASQKVKLMRQSAIDLGLKNWNCTSIKFLF